MAALTRVAVGTLQVPVASDNEQSKPLCTLVIASRKGGGSKGRETSSTGTADCTISEGRGLTFSRAMASNGSVSRSFRDRVQSFTLNQSVAMTQAVRSHCSSRVTADHASQALSSLWLNSSLGSCGLEGWQVASTSWQRTVATGISTGVTLPKGPYSWRTSSKPQCFTSRATYSTGLGERDGDDAVEAPSWVPRVDVGAIAASVVVPLQEPSSIHPTAIVHPDAILGEGVTVGAYCLIGPGAKLGADCVLQPYSSITGDTELGERCVLKSGAVVGEDLPGKTIIGNDNVIGYHAVVGVKCQDLKYKEGDACFLVIGDKNDIREHASIHRSSRSDLQTVIGNNNLIMGSCHVAHDCCIGDHNILANATLLAGHVVVENYAHTGGAVAVHQFCQIGSYAFLAGGSMVDRDVPTYMMVAGDRAALRGLNLEGLRRCGFKTEEVRNIRRAYQKLFMSNDEGAAGLEQRLAELEASEEFGDDVAVAALIKSIKDSFGDRRRGICKFRHWTAA